MLEKIHNKMTGIRKLKKLEVLTILVVCIQPITNRVAPPMSP